MSNAFDDVEMVGSLENNPGPDNVIGLSENRHLLPGENIYKFIPDHIKYDRDLVLAAVRRDGSALKFVPDELKNDKKFMFLVTANFPPADLNYMKHAMDINQEAFFNPPKELKDLKDLTDGMQPLSRYILYAKNALDTPPVDPSVSATLDNMFKL